MDTLARLAQHVFFRHFAILEDKFARRRPAHAELVELLSQMKAYKTALDQKSRDAMRAGIWIGLGIDDEGRGVGAVGDPHFCAVQDVALAVFVRAKAHRDDVGAGIRLRHGERADMLAGYQVRQIAALLVVIAVAADLIDARSE